jgi:hypothetical protein
MRRHTTDPARAAGASPPDEDRVPIDHPIPRTKGHHSENAVVARWSKGQVFAQIVSTENLAAGQKWHFRGRQRMPLNLRRGDYTLRIYLTADKRPAAESSLHVTVPRSAPNVA